MNSSNMNNNDDTNTRGHHLAQAPYFFKAPTCLSFTTPSSPIAPSPDFEQCIFIAPFLAPPASLFLEMLCQFPVEILFHDESQPLHSPMRSQHSFLFFLCISHCVTLPP